MMTDTVREREREGGVTILCNPFSLKSLDQRQRERGKRLRRELVSPMGERTEDSCVFLSYDARTGRKPLHTPFIPRM